MGAEDPFYPNRFRRDKGGGSGTPNSVSSDVAGGNGRDLERGSGERSDTDVVGVTDALKVGGVYICNSDGDDSSGGNDDDGVCGVAPTGSEDAPSTHEQHL